MGTGCHPHLGLVPLLGLLHVAGSHGLVLRADIAQRCRQVWLAGIHLHVHLVLGQLLLQLPQLLQGTGVSEAMRSTPGASHRSNVTSSCTFWRKATSSCRDPTRRSRSRRARAAASTSCHHVTRRDRPQGEHGDPCPHPSIAPPVIPAQPSPVPGDPERGADTHSPPHPLPSPAGTQPGCSRPPAAG